MVMQAVFAIVMLTVTFLLNNGIRERMNQPLGYEIKNILQSYGLNGLKQQQRLTFRNQMLKLPEVEAVGFGGGTHGRQLFL